MEYMMDYSTTSTIKEKHYSKGNKEKHPILAIIFILSFFILVANVMSVDVWDRPVFQLNYNISNLSNYYTKTQIDYFFNQTNTYIDIVNDSILYPSGDYFIINNTAHTFIFNETKNNLTIRSISKIYEYEYIMNISGNNYSISSIYIGFEIKQVIVIPSINDSIYRFELIEYPSGDIIDRNRIPHKDIWSIEKNYAINYSQVLANITDANINNNFSIIIKYLSNGVE